MNTNKKQSSGFVLPTVVIASLVLMALLVVALQAAVNIRGNINEQYYQQLARTAAESGLARATSCLANNNYIAEWSGVNKLHPHSTCVGTGDRCQGGDNCYVTNGITEKTWYSVSAPVRSGATQTVEVTGTVDILRRSSGTIRRQVTQTLKSRVGADVNFNTVTFGYNFNGSYFSALGDDGKMYMVGYNEDGQLGNGTTTSSTTPSTFILPPGKRAVAAFTSFLSIGFHTYVITEDGMGYSTGRNTVGQLGVGSVTTTPISTPQVIQVPGVPSLRRFKSITPLHNSTFFMMSDNTMWAAGRCSSGQLGIGPTSCTNQSTPQQMAGLPTDFVPAKISADRTTGYVMGENGAVYGWGMNDRGQLANFSYTDAFTPIVIGSFNGTTRKARDIAFDGLSIYIVDQDGAAWAAGADHEGQLGIGTTGYNDVRSMTRMDLSACAGNAIKVSTDQWSVSVLTDAGEVCSAGLNNYGQLGNGNIWHQTTPRKFILPAGVKAVDVYATGVAGDRPNINNTFVIGDNGRVYGAGANSFGQLGDGTTTNRSTPVPMQVFDGVNVRAERVLAGNGTTVILSTDKKIYTVGNNSHGQLGDGTTSNSSTPKANRFTNIIPITYY